MTSTLHANKVYLSAPIVDEGQATTKYYVDDLKSQSDVFANQVKSDILGGLPAEALDTIKELADFLAADGTVAGGLATQISSVNIKIAEEKSRAQIAENTISFAVTTEKQRAEGAEMTLSAQLSAQVAKQASDKTASDNATGVVSSDLSVHKSAYEVYKSASASAIVAEKARVDSAFAEEKKAREDADSAEVVAREQGLAQLSGDISETTSSLQSQITSEVSARESGLAQLAGDFSETTQSLQSQVSAEVDARSSADSSHDQKLNEEYTARVASVADLESRKMDKSGGSFTGSVGVASLSYLYIGNHWRIAGSVDGKRLQFEHSSLGKDAPSAVWSVGVPFIEE